MFKKSTFALALVSSISALQITEEEFTYTMDDFIYGFYQEAADKVMGEKPENEGDMYDFVWSVWDVLWQFENFRIYVDGLEYGSAEFQNAIDNMAPVFLNIINTGLTKIGEGAEANLITYKEIWWILDIEDIENVLKLLTDMHVTNDEIKADFAKNDHNPKEADYIQYGVGYSVDGSETYEWTSYTDEDWLTIYGLEPGWDDWLESAASLDSGTGEYAEECDYFWNDWDQWDEFDAWEEEWDTMEDAGGMCDDFYWDNYDWGDDSWSWDEEFDHEEYDYSSDGYSSDGYSSDGYSSDYYSSDYYSSDYYSGDYLSSDCSMDGSSFGDMSLPAPPPDYDGSEGSLMYDHFADTYVSSDTLLPESMSADGVRDYFQSSDGTYSMENL